MTLHAAKNIHIVGIGGIGVSAIAKWSWSKANRFLEVTYEKM